MDSWKSLSIILKINAVPFLLGYRVYRCRKGKRKRKASEARQGKSSEEEVKHNEAGQA